MKSETNNYKYATGSNMLNINNETARNHRKSGQYTKAIKVYDKIVAANSKTYGDNHVITLRSISRLANTYYAKGDYPKALDLFKTVYAKRLEKLGDSDLNTLRSMTSIANCYFKMESFEQSAALHEKVLKLRNSMLGAHHGRTALSKKRLSEANEELKRSS